MRLRISLIVLIVLNCTVVDKKMQLALNSWFCSCLSCDKLFCSPLHPPLPPLSLPSFSCPKCGHKGLPNHIEFRARWIDIFVSNCIYHIVMYLCIYFFWDEVSEKISHKQYLHQLMMQYMWKFIFLYMFGVILESL